MRVLPYAAIGIAVLLGCDTAPAGDRAGIPDTAAVHTDTAAAHTAVAAAYAGTAATGTAMTAAGTATKAPPASPGRGFRMHGDQIVADTFEVPPACATAGSRSCSIPTSGMTPRCS
jgi:hypothetical protein